MDDYIVITGHNYMITNDILLNIAVVVGIICAAVVVVAYKSKRMEEPTKCGCGKSESGLCDGSHTIHNNDLSSPSSGSIEYSS